jgi:hypothetical protein
MMGAEGLRRATELAILNANYMAKRLAGFFPVLYTAPNGLVAHECIIDVRPLSDKSGITVEDVAKRLMDYGFHAPTMSWPVAGTLMIEPTESEPLAELDRFCDAMIAIAGEIARVKSDDWDRLDNPLKNAPHTAFEVAGDWTHPYSRELAVYPLPWVRDAKFWHVSVAPPGFIEPGMCITDGAFSAFDRNISHYQRSSLMRVVRGRPMTALLVPMMMSTPSWNRERSPMTSFQKPSGIPDGVICAVSFMPGPVRLRILPPSSEGQASNNVVERSGYFGSPELNAEIGSNSVADKIAKAASFGSVVIGQPQ